MSRLRPIHTIMQTKNQNIASVIFLHGSGLTGKSISDWIKFLFKEFSLPHVKFIFPTAPARPYIPMNGEMSHVWFNRYDITPDVPEHEESLQDIKTDITALISKEVECGIPLYKIIIGGFSMGGALALHTAYRFVPGLAGVFTLSSFLSNESAVYKEFPANHIPLLMCHGDSDTLIPSSWGRTTFNRLTNLGAKGEFIPIKDTLHELERHELEILLKWITKVIPPTVT